MFSCLRPRTPNPLPYTLYAYVYTVYLFTQGRGRWGELNQKEGWRGNSSTMDEGRERDNTSRKGGRPTLPGLYLCTIQPSQRGFFRVHTFVWRERVSLWPNFKTFQDPRHQFGISRLVSNLLFRGLFIATYAGGNDSLEIFALLKSLKIRALENYICLLRHTFIDF